jgi:sec-independent protein translocase protein TatA
VFENVGGGEILLILIVILIFFGPKKIPELAQSLGKGMRKFNEAKEGLESQVKTAIKEPLEDLTKAKQGLEAQLRSVAEPLHAELKLPTSQAQPHVPAQPPVPETLPRGTSDLSAQADQSDQSTPPVVPVREA